MNQNQKEQLSSLIDEELSEFEQHQLLKDIDNPEFNKAWSRYHLIHDALGGETIDADAFDLSARIHAELDKEEIFHATPVRSANVWWKAVGGAAIAASVAMVTVFSLSEESAQLPMMATMSTAPAPISMNSWDVQTVGTHWQVDKPEVENTLNRYLLEHSDQTSRQGVNGMLPYATLVGYDRK